MADIVVSEFMDEAALAPFSPDYSRALRTRSGRQTGRAFAALGDASAIIVRNRTQVNQTLLDAAPHLRCVGRLGVGLDNIDLDACAARDITVYPATGANDLSVAEYVVVTAALMLLRRAWFATPDVAAGQWPRNQLMGAEISARPSALSVSATLRVAPVISAGPSA